MLSEAASKRPENLDGHFRPQWGHCPFCLFDFDVVGRMDTYDRDVEYVFNRLNLTVSRPTITMQVNACLFGSTSWPET